jgi:hypothetical protein
MYEGGWAFVEYPCMENKHTVNQTLGPFALKLGWVASWKICMLCDTSDAPRTGGMVLLGVCTSLLIMMIRVYCWCISFGYVNCLFELILQFLDCKAQLTPELANSLTYQSF